MVEQVKASMTKAFEHFSVKDGIIMKDVRVKITKKGGSLDFDLMNKTEIVRKTSLKEMVGAMTAMLVQSHLTDSVAKTIRDNGLTEREANLRIYPLADNSPSTYLYREGKPFLKIDIEKLIN